MFLLAEISSIGNAVDKKAAKLYSVKKSKRLRLA